MAIEFLEALATDLLENKNLVCLCIIIEDGSLYDCAFYIRSTDLDCTLVVEEKYLVELYISTLGLRKSLDKDFVASFNFELLTGNFNDCVHKKTLLKVSAVSVCHLGQLFINGLAVI